MSVTLTTEQFTALLSNISKPLPPPPVLKPESPPKKKTKSLIKDYVDAIDFEQFLEHLEFLKVTKLMTMDLCEFIFQTIKMNIEPLEDNELPFVCANSQKRTFYYKSKGEWKKGTEFIKLLFNKIWKRASTDLCEKFNKIQDNVNDDDDDETIERKFESSKHYEKQLIIKSLCYADKYSSDKIIEKILNKLGKFMKNDNFDIEK
jgi:hypothetical protein